MIQGRRQLRFPSVLESIHLAEKLVDDVCAEYKVKEDFYGEVLICLTEGVNNAVVHGNRMNTDLQVSLTFELADEKTLRFIISDEGPGFDY
ncbi:MAG: ATP-binding protein, partial [Flavobacteriales bacterium]